MGSFFDASQNDDDDDQNNNGSGGPTGPNDDDDNSPIFMNMGGSGSVPPWISGSMSASSTNTVPEDLIEYNSKFTNHVPAKFRDTIIHQILAVLIKNMKPNVLMVGTAGTGKTKIVEEISRLIATKSPVIPQQLKNSTIYELQLSSLVSGTMFRGMLEEKLKRIIEFISDEDNDAILFIDEIHMLADTNNPSMEEIAQTLKPALARGDMRVIGATTMNESKSFDSDPALKRRFSRIIVNELNNEQTYEILEDTRNFYLKHYKNELIVTDENLRDILNLSNQHKISTAQPDSALTLMDSAMAERVVDNNVKIQIAQKAKDVQVVHLLKMNKPLTLTWSMINKTAKRLTTGVAEPPELNNAAMHRLKNRLGEIIDQDQATQKIYDAIQRDQVRVTSRERPISWLLVGPAGTGKTETAKIVADAFVDKKPIIINMTEFSESHSITSLLGSSPGYIGSNSNAEMPLDPLKSDRHQVILLDEIEKAHPDVQRLFFSALDEGYITNKRNEIIDFSQALVIATTNAADDEMSRPATGFSISGAANQATLDPVSVLTKTKIFDNAFLSRFSAIIPYQKLSKNAYREIIKQKYSQALTKTLEASQRASNTSTTSLSQQLLPTIPDDQLDTLVESTYNAAIGARPARQAAEGFLENQLVQLKFAAPVTTSNNLPNTIKSDDEELLPLMDDFDDLSD